MKITKILLQFALLAVLVSIISCSDSEIDSQFTASMTDRNASLSLSVDNNTFTLSAASGSESFYLICDDNWEISSDASWVFFTTTSGNTNSIIHFSVQENTSDQVRSATIKISGIQSQKFINVYVYQKGTSLEVETEKVEFDYSGGTKEIAVTTSGSFEVAYSVDWISCAQTSNSIKITAKPNPDIDSRSTTISISLKNSEVKKQVEILQYGGSGIKIEDFGEDINL